MLIGETGHFSTLWAELAGRLGLQVEVIPGDWRHGADPDAVGERLAADTEHAIKAVCVVHNETSTGVTSRVPEVRAAIDAAGHPALLLVDTISSLASIDYRHDEWGVDVTVGGLAEGPDAAAGAGLQRGQREGARGRRARPGCPASYWDWAPILEANARGFFPYTPATNLLYGLREALAMLDEEGLPAVFARHQRHAAATRAAVRAWGLEVLCADEREHSGSLTAVLLPDRSRRRQGAPDHPRAVRHVARHRARAGSPARCSGSGTSATSTT